MAEKNEMDVVPLFSSPLIQVQLDLDLEKLTEFAFQMQNKDKKGSNVPRSSRGGWQSNDITEENHEEFIRLKKEISQYLQTYHSEVFQGMEFKTNVVQSIANTWVNINEKNHWNEWHLHPGATLSGVYYIKHDGCVENGNILFKHPVNQFTYIITNHWPLELIKKHNEVTSKEISFTPKSNMLLLFPSWLKHKVQVNLKNESRISLSFNSRLEPEIK